MQINIFDKAVYEYRLFKNNMKVKIRLYQYYRGLKKTLNLRNKNNTLVT